MCRDSRAHDDLSGIRRANSFEMLLPSETMLLSPRSAERSRRPKLLFLAKYAEAQLRSYEMTGWVEAFSRSKRKPWNHFTRLPVTTGGPIIVCLDTSYSMAGPREQLAKAVVLEVAMMGARDHRPFFLLAFSGAQNLAECELRLRADKHSLVTLLAFLGSAFRGGTDVTTPLTRAVELLEDSADWASADVLLVTDGELMNPPLPPQLMEKILHLERERGLEVHGLLVGNDQPTPQLQSICTKWDGLDRVHNFLYKYDPLLKVFCDPSAGEEEEEAGAVLQRGQARFTARCAGTRAVGRLSSRAPRGASGPRGRTTALAMLPPQQQEPQERIDASAAAPNPPITPDDASAAAVAPLGLLIADVTERLAAGLIERETEVRLLLLAALCREHIILLGPPGTGKSELARRMGSIAGGVFFERLLTKFTAPEEVFGPLSLAALEKDQYVRNIVGYLPNANMAFLDEIFKSSSSILNSFLTILNERLYDNGNERIKVPLLAVVGASNELPDSEELDALYDRFLFRRMVSPISDKEVHRLFASSSIEADPTCTSSSVGSGGSAEAMISEALTDRIVHLSNAVTLPPAIIAVLTSMRVFLRDGVNPSIYISDRRLKKAAKALKVSAYCNGRSAVGLTDCLLLQHMLWYAPEEKEIIADWLWENLVPQPDIASIAFLANAIARRLESAVSSDSPEALQIETAELAALRAVVCDKQQDAALCASQYTKPDHLFLDAHSLWRTKQVLGPAAQLVESRYDLCSQALNYLQQELSLANLSSDGARTNSADSLASVVHSPKWRAAFGTISGGVPGVDPSSSESADVDGGGAFDKLDMGLSVKEAKRTLSKEQFKEWKRLKGREDKPVDSYWT